MYSGIVCVRFRYYMYGADMGRFLVTVSDRYTLLEVNGNQGQRWIEYSVDINAQSGDKVRALF